MSFTPGERARLQAQPGIGPGVLARLEQLGLDSLAKLHDAGTEHVVARVCDNLGSPAWRNRRRALARALAVLFQQQATPEGWAR